MTIPSLTLPPGWSAMGSPPPDFASAADGSAFYGVQAKLNGGGYVYAVFWQKPGQVAVRVDSGTSGQGQLRGGGVGPLWVVRYAAPGDGQVVQVVEIVQFARWPEATGVPGPKGDTGAQGPQGPQGVPGAAGSGGALTAEQAADLAWVASLRALLKG